MTDEPSPFVTAEPEPQRLLPAAPKAEHGLLASFLIDPMRVGSMCAEQRVVGDIFHLPQNATLFYTVMEMWTKGKPIDLITVTNELHKRRVLEECGGASHISELFRYPTAANAESYVEILREKHALRGIIGTCTTFNARAYAEQDNVEGLVNEFHGAVTVFHNQKGVNVRSMHQLAIDKISRMENPRGAGVVIPTGIIKLDRESPLTLGSMLVIAGKPKSGKSILKTTILAEMIRNNRRALCFELEDPADALVDRLTANLSRVPIARHDSTRWQGVDPEEIGIAVKRISESALTIRDDVFDIGPMSAIIRQEKAMNPDLEAVFVDYGQLVRAKTRKQDTREQEVAQVSRTLRLLSNEFKLAMVVLSQLNDDGETRESRALQQDCTAIVKVTPVKDEPGLRDIEIPYQRNGCSQIKFRTAFLGHICRVENYTAKEQD